VLGGRPISMVLREAVRPRNYAALWRMWRLTPSFREAATRYFLGSGSYPYDCPLRTPTGQVTPTLYSHHDMWTVNEVFLREDYAAGEDTAVVVDVGSNIGVSALYFLSRNTRSRCYLYEPVPRNLERLDANLDGYVPRTEVHPVAVGPEGGMVQFGLEPTGRYGGVGVSSQDTISVPCVGINELLADVVEREGSIDILKVDTEGLELETVRAIRPEMLDRIKTIYYEWPRPAPLHADRFRFSFYNETNRLTRR
jgi:FkbM family methyltransferase